MRKELPDFRAGACFWILSSKRLQWPWVDRHAVRGHSLPLYQGGLTPARLRKVVELIHAKAEDNLSLDEMADTAGLSVRTRSTRAGFRFSLRFQNATTFCTNVPAYVRSQPYIGAPICPVRSVLPIRHKSQRVASWNVMIKSFNKASCNLPYRTSGALRVSRTICTSGSSPLDVSATDPGFLSISTNSGPM